ncbi:hypothetical protein [Bradyrhizobium erythrophlei]|uniref:hypothetical protein n=1 Tax=Bradyrhizobium erythrophlei TaxID=1437360 RepID=UPI0012AC5591|nr:hypothetical protein [Bradyrhizobium erythrophlei]
MAAFARSRGALKWRAGEERTERPYIVEVGSREVGRETVPGMDPISSRMRHFLAFVVVAGITAAVLRHFFHVNVGFSREEIRMGALIAAIVAIFLVVVLFRRKRRP